MKAAIRDKHLRLNQEKIEKAKNILMVKTETEAIEKALDLIIENDIAKGRRREVMRRIFNRREKLGKIKGNVEDWISEGRKEREKMYGR